MTNWILLQFHNRVVYLFGWLAEALRRTGRRRRGPGGRWTSDCSISEGQNGATDGYRPSSSLQPTTTTTAEETVSTFLASSLMSLLPWRSTQFIRVRRQQFWFRVPTFLNQQRERWRALRHALYRLLRTTDAAPLAGPADRSQGPDFVAEDWNVCVCFFFTFGDRSIIETSLGRHQENRWTKKQNKNKNKIESDRNRKKETTQMSPVPKCVLTWRGRQEGISSFVVFFFRKQVLNKGRRKKMM